MRCMRMTRFRSDVVFGKNVNSSYGYDENLFDNGIREQFKERLSRLSSESQAEFSKCCKLAANVAMNNEKWMKSAKIRRITL